jgi:hypothetical protein
MNLRLCFAGSVLIAGSVLVAGCKKQSASAAPPVAKSSAPALSDAQAAFVAAQIEKYDLARYSPAGPDWEMVLTTANGYRNIHPNAAVDHIKIPLDADNLGENGSLSLSFLLSLDPHRVSFSQTQAHQQNAYLNHLRALTRAIERAQSPEEKAASAQEYLQKIMDYLQQEHGFTPQNIEVARQIAHGIVQKAEARGLRQKLQLMPDPTRAP